MITQYIKEKGIQQGLRQGMQQGVQQGIQQGVRQGLIEGIELAIHLRFGAKGAQVARDLQNIEDITVLRKIKEALKTAETPDEIIALIKH